MSENMEACPVCDTVPEVTTSCDIDVVVCPECGMTVVERERWNEVASAVRAHDTLLAEIARLRDVARAAEALLRAPRDAHWVERARKLDTALKSARSSGARGGGPTAPGEFVTMTIAVQALRGLAENPPKWWDDELLTKHLHDTIKRGIGGA